MPVLARLAIVSLAAVAVLGSTLASRVRIDHVTKPPTVTSPAPSSTVSGPIPVAFELPEAARPGSVVLVIAPTGGTTSTVALADANDKGTHNVSVDPDDLSALGTVSGPTRLDDGEYTVRVHYADARQNPAASSDLRSFTIARTTIPGPVAEHPQLNVRWWIEGGTLHASFPALSRAQSYTMVLHRGTLNITDTCTAGAAGVTCAVALPHPSSRWSATVSAEANGRTLARAGRAREVS